MFNLKEFIIGSKDTRPHYPWPLSDRGLSAPERRRMAARWLRTFQVANIDFLRHCDYSRVCGNKNVTLLIYTFPRSHEEFLQIEFAIRHSWRVLGRMKTVVVADKENPDLARLRDEWPNDIEIQYEGTLQPGTIKPMSVDCITRLHTRFDTDYCLIIQDDGLPMRDMLNEFVGKYDYLGCSTYRNIRKPLQRMVEFRKKYILNGGFSLRSRKICKLAASTYEKCKREIPIGSSFHIEDVFYTVYARSIPSYERNVRFPSLSFARRFAISDLFGAIDVHMIKPQPFGFHDVTTAIQYIPEFKSMGYKTPSIP